MPIIEIAAVVVSALGVWLTTRRNLLCWPVSLISVILYGIVFYRAKLYSDVILQAIFAAFILYGWWKWLRGVKDDGTVRVERISQPGLIIGLAAGALGSFALGYGMARYTDATIPWVDSTLTSFSLVAQYWMTRKYIVNWWLWIVVDIAYTAVLAYKHLLLTSGLYAAFVLLAVLGLRSWSAAWLEQQSGASQAAPLTQ